MPDSTVLDVLETALQWPFLTVLSRLGMAVAMGLFIGLEREHSQKRGVRTFALTGLLGGLGGMMGPVYGGAALLFVAITVGWMNHREMAQAGKLTLTTSMSLVLVAFTGILFGQGHVFTPSVAGIITAALLAWKNVINDFAIGLSDAELRSGILLAILTFIIFPVLPSQPVDPWGLVQPRENWASVIIIAGIGFVNYILLKLLGPRGMEITAFFGGLVNSRKVVVELGGRLGELGTGVQSSVHRGIILSTGAMILRNGLIVGIFSPIALPRCVLPLGLMLLVSIFRWWSRTLGSRQDPVPALPLESPFKLWSALKFGLAFMVLNVLGALANRHFGSASFYFVSMSGGLISSASAITSAATLMAQHEIPTVIGVNGVILSTLTSILSNVPLIRGMIRPVATGSRICRDLIVMAAAGLAGMLLNGILIRAGVDWLAH
ncbi:MAG: MgtC/SapB family protein [Opitutaceae bacterium]|nr:MgtC/SapB family protein [Opitutaceae bacterium]